MSPLRPRIQRRVAPNVCAGQPRMAPSSRRACSFQSASTSSCSANKTPLNSSPKASTGTAERYRLMPHARITTSSLFFLSRPIVKSAARSADDPAPRRRRSARPRECRKQNPDLPTAGPGPPHDERDANDAEQHVRHPRRHAGRHPPAQREAARREQQHIVDEQHADAEDEAGELAFLSIGGAEREADHREDKASRWNRKLLLDREQL